MNYKIVFSVQGLINEYIEPAEVIRDGRLKTVPSLSELETLTFPEPFGELEAFQTSGGTSTLPRTLAGRVPNLDYKTIRYQGHCAQFRLLHELGLCDGKPVDFKDGQVSPREMLAHVLTEKLDLPGEDVVLVLVEAEGWDAAGKAVRRTVRIIDRHDRQQRHLRHDAHDRLPGRDHRLDAGQRRDRRPRRPLPGTGGARRPDDRRTAAARRGDRGVRGRAGPARAEAADAPAAAPS